MKEKNNFTIRLRSLACIIIVLMTCVPNSLQQIVIDPDEFVDPPGYPFTLVDYLKVLDSFAAGYKIYANYPISKKCMESLEQYTPVLESTYLAWTEVNLLNPGFTKYDNETGEAIYNIYSEGAEY